MRKTGRDGVAVTFSATVSSKSPVLPPGTNTDVVEGVKQKRGEEAKLKKRPEEMTEAPKYDLIHLSNRRTADTLIRAAYIDGRRIHRQADLPRRRTRPASRWGRPIRTSSPVLSNGAGAVELDDNRHAAPDQDDSEKTDPIDESNDLDSSKAKWFSLLVSVHSA